MNESDIASLFEEGGPFSKTLKGFEGRDEQKKMMKDVLTAFNKPSVALIEAGTGTGKSLAYLVPAAIFASKNGEKVLISTNTIALQEQLIQKDIPLIAKALNLPIRAEIVKGMGNYLCLKNLTDCSSNAEFFPAKEQDEIRVIEAFSESGAECSKSALPIYPSYELWERLKADPDSCTHQKCEFFEQCHFFKARKKAEEAHLLISNHHLFLIDLARRASEQNYEGTAVLPPYSRVIIDEAHHLEDVATEYFATKVNSLDLYRQLSKFGDGKSGKSESKFLSLRRAIDDHYKKQVPLGLSSIGSRLQMDLPGNKNDLMDLIRKTFLTYDEFLFILLGKERTGLDELGEEKLRLLPAHTSHPFWKGTLVPETDALIDALKRFSQSLNALERDLKALGDEKLDERTRSLRFEIQALGSRLCESAEALRLCIHTLENENEVSWIETRKKKHSSTTELVKAKLDIRAELANFLFSPFKTTILCSATLAANQSFEFVKAQLGLHESFLPELVCRESIYNSPFDYKNQTLLAITTDLPDPASSDFVKEAAEAIWKLVIASRGNAFILFTSYGMLEMVYQKLADRLNGQRFSIFKQGTANRKNLLDEFKKGQKGVLFGTDTFWEGVDVAGEALRLVVIVKLPFRVPSEPIIQARSEAIAKNGKDPFRSFSLPSAIVKFKQGFGRLIRHKFDRGVIVCLDKRLLQKSYGKQFLNSLPECQACFSTLDKVVDEMGAFYRKTHHFTNAQKR